MLAKLTPFLFLAILTTHQAQAGCVSGTEGVCGDKKICVSNLPRAASGRKDRNSCLPKPVCGALKSIAADFGRVEIASAQRVNNASRGGAKNSWHISCNAADFFVPNHESSATQQKLAKKLRTLTVGRNVYCTGRAHVSVSPRENFYSTCVGGVRARAMRAHR